MFAIIYCGDPGTFIEKNNVAAVINASNMFSYINHNIDRTITTSYLYPMKPIATRDHVTLIAAVIGWIRVTT